MPFYESGPSVESEEIGGKKRQKSH